MEEIKYGGLKRALIILIPVFLVTGFIILYNKQEQQIDEKLDNCSFYTVAAPLKMFNAHKFRFTFSYGGKHYTRDERVGAEDLGWNYNRSDVINRRFWVRMHCTDLSTFRFYWQTKVPDTLQHIPATGWKEIPHGL